MTSHRASEALKALSQILAIACMALLVSVILHKGYADVSRLAEQHSGKRFWVALAQYFIGNLAGGAKPAADAPPGEKIL